jgi:hypothetical protein
MMIISAPAFKRKNAFDIDAIFATVLGRDGRDQVHRGVRLHVLAVQPGVPSEVGQSVARSDHIMLQIFVFCFFFSVLNSPHLT